MINEIRRRLEAGEKVELECIERSLFLSVNDGAVFDENLEILESGLVVDRVSVSTISLLDCPHPIMIDEIQYFKIKEGKKTFHDLVDVAVQAVKDELISINGITNWQIQYTAENKTRYIVSHDHRRIEEEIDYIKSLYTETFIIESEEDISKVKSGAEIALANGCKGIVEATSSRTSNPFLRIPFDDCSMTLYLFSLKGAAVTQKKD